MNRYLEKIASKGKVSKDLLHIAKNNPLLKVPSALLGKLEKPVQTPAPTPSPIGRMLTRAERSQMLKEIDAQIKAKKQAAKKPSKSVLIQQERSLKAGFSTKDDANRLKPKKITHLFRSDDSAWNKD